MRRITAVLAIALLATVGGCTSSSKKPSAGGSTSAGATALSQQMQSAISGITSAHVNVDASLLGQKISGSGTAQFSTGNLSALDISGTVPSVGALRLVAVGGKLYAKLPPALNPSHKTWVTVTSSSNNAIVGQLASVFTQVEAAGSLSNLPPLVAAAKSLTDKGTDATRHHYVLVVDASKLPASFPGKSDFANAPLAGKPIDIWVDAQNRPTQISRTALVSGSPVAITIALSGFNAGVSITAPPASEVATG